MLPTDGALVGAQQPHNPHYYRLGSLESREYPQKGQIQPALLRGPFGFLPGALSSGPGRRFRCSASSIGRWEIKECMVPIRIGDTVIHPDDFVFGDCDGAVIIPKALTVEVLLKTEEIVRRENGLRADLEKGLTVSEVYRKHGKF